MFFINNLDLRNSEIPEKSGINGKIVGPKLLVPLPPQDRVKLVVPPL